MNNKTSDKTNEERLGKKLYRNVQAYRGGQADTQIVCVRVCVCVRVYGSMYGCSCLHSMYICMYVCRPMYVCTFGGQIREYSCWKAQPRSDGS